MNVVVTLIQEARWVVGAAMIALQLMSVQLANMIVVAITHLVMEQLDAIAIQKKMRVLGVGQVVHMDKLGVQLMKRVHVENHANQGILKNATHSAMDIPINLLVVANF
jgi:hypothetical protein